MSDGFEWVSSDTPPEEKKEAQALPVVVKQTRTPSFGYRLWLVLRKLISIMWHFFLTIAARILLLVIRTKYPKPVVPDFVKVWAGRIIDKAREWRKHFPALFVIPRAIYYWRPPKFFVNSLTSGGCFLAVLVGLGSIFSSLENGLSLSSVFLIFAGLAAGFWLLWQRGFAAVVAKWILRAAKQRDNRRG